MTLAPRGASDVPTLASVADLEALMAANDDVRMLVEAKASAMFETNRRTLGCFDCGLCYGDDGWIECVVPNDVWRQLSPDGDETGILCITCIARRAKRLGLPHFAVMLCGTEPMRLADQDEAFERGWRVAERRIKELEDQITALTTRSAALEAERDELIQALGRASDAIGF